MKTCKACQKARPVEDFRSNGGNGERRKPLCRFCEQDRRASSRKTRLVPLIPPDRQRVEGRYCTWCSTKKPPEAFYVNRRNGGLLPTCRECYPVLRRVRAELNPEVVRGGQRRRRLRAQYGLTLEAYKAMAETQGGQCAICGGDNNGRRLHVDHNHATNQVRELLCFPCNALLGHASENPEILTAAARYLAKHKAV